jgi:hypothetical protein
MSEPQLETAPEQPAGPAAAPADPGRGLVAQQSLTWSAHCNRSPPPSVSL